MNTTPTLVTALDVCVLDGIMHRRRIEYAMVDGAPLVEGDMSPTRPDSVAGPEHAKYANNKAVKDVYRPGCVDKGAGPTGAKMAASWALNVVKATPCPACYPGGVTL